jgi:hypothetical protein
VTPVSFFLLTDIFDYGLTSIIELYDDAESFKPERYLGSEFGTRPDADTSDFRGDWIFGSGRVSSWLLLTECLILTT